MTKVTIVLAPADVMRDWFWKGQSLDMVRESLPRYVVAGQFETDKTGKAAADEAFDLTGNESRQEEREEKYGRGRSVSVGDIVLVDGVMWVCMANGWSVLNKTA